MSNTNTNKLLKTKNSKQKIMTCKNCFSLQLWGTVIILSTTVLSCTSNDSTDSSSATPADTAKAAVTPPAKDSVAKMNTNDSITNSQGDMVKPNPAKKGMKGKVTILPSVKAAADAKMEADAEGVYSNTEILPSYPGGDKGLQKFFDRNLVYPAEADDNGVEGTVTLRFVVDENGKLTNPEVIGKRVGYGLEAEALRVVSKMPVWNPGKLKGKNVKTKFTLPVKFVLE